MDELRKLEVRECLERSPRPSIVADAVTLRAPSTPEVFKPLDLVRKAGTRMVFSLHVVDLQVPLVVGS